MLNNGRVNGALDANFYIILACFFTTFAAVFMTRIMKHLRSYVLPFAIVLGLVFHAWCAYLKIFVPYLIFSILILSFSTVNIRKLRITMLDVWLMLFQIVVSLGCYFLLMSIKVNPIVAQGVLVGVICPVAASVVVIACMLGANRETVTTYSILGNLMVAVVAPIFFSFIGVHQEIPFWDSFLLILGKIGPVIGLPFFIVLFLQRCLPKINTFISKYQHISFYLWSVALFITLGQTIDFMFLNGKDNISAIIWLGITSILFCAIQFGIGKLIGHHYGDTIAGGQLLGQKNTSMGIWIANSYLNPLASIFPALYSIWQNLFNSWQMWRHEKKK